MYVESIHIGLYRHFLYKDGYSYSTRSFFSRFFKNTSQNRELRNQDSRIDDKFFHCFRNIKDAQRVKLSSEVVVKVLIPKSAIVYEGNWEGDELTYCTTELKVLGVCVN